MNSFEIVKAKNGFMIFIKDRSRDLHESPWVFETIEGAMNFLKEKFENQSAICGSCSGSGFIK